MTLSTPRSSSRRSRRSERAALLFFALLLLALGGACRSKREAPAPPPPVSYDDRELAALAGAGREIPDAGAHPGTGVSISDAQAALFDESLCTRACEHLFELLLAEQRLSLTRDPEGLALFEEDLDRVRSGRTRACVNDCRRLADLAAVECVLAARNRLALEGCDL